MKEKVAVLMSGGVDSSVAALLLREEGYEVTGVTLRLFGPKTKGIPSLPMDLPEKIVERAAKVAEYLGIPHVVLDLCEEFQETVLDSFISEYMNGRTPNPCIWCNPTIKFGAAAKRLLGDGFQRVASGHYARIHSCPDGLGLFKGRDPIKDQSYFLSGLPRSILRRILFPLGEETKTNTREIARRYGLPIGQIGESQDVCFVEGDDYRRLLSHSGKEGNFVHVDGRILGRHLGIAHYTIGQRKGLHLGGGTGEALYILRIDSGTGDIIVGSRKEMEKDRVVARDANFLADLHIGMTVTAKIRSQMENQPATITDLSDRTCTIRFEKAQFAVTPGQAAVLYDGDRVLAGGIIDDMECGGLPPLSDA
jgi:tRNA-specific 2-thiouridylase